MTFKGVVKNGVVVLPENLKLPDGIEVEVEVPDDLISDWDEAEWERRVKAIQAMMGIGQSSGGSVGRRKHEVLAEVYGSERRNANTSNDEKSAV